MESRLIGLVTAAAAVAAIAGAASAQSGEYFITTEDLATDEIRVIQSGVIKNSWVPPLRRGAIAVGPGDSVRTIEEAMGTGASFIGEEYDKNGALIGPAGPLDTTGIGMGRIIDGGFDGQNTYVVSGFDAFGATIGEVWAFGPGFDGGAGTFLFNVGQNDQGITYDTVTNTIWTSEYNLGSTSAGLIKQYDLMGNLLFSFPAQRSDPNGRVFASERNTALAYDPSDDTLWFNAHVDMDLSGTTGELWQFDRNGNFLQAIDPDPNADVLYWGGEFSIPSPGAAALAAIGAVALTRRRR